MKKFEKQEEPKILHAMFAEATVGILVVNSSGEIVKSNPYSEELFGYKKGELIGEKIEILLPSSFRKRHVGHREKYHKKPTPRTMGADLELFGLRKDTTQFPVQISLSYMKIDDNLYAIAYVSDDSFQKKLIRELRESKSDLDKKIEERTKELRESEIKLKAALAAEKDLGELKSRFVSMASHEFRTPLTSILSSSALAKRYEKEEQQEKRLKHLKRIDSSVRNLTTILNDFLSLEKLESGKMRYEPTEFDLEELIIQVIDEVTLTAKPGQEVIFKNTADKTVKADEHLLKNILINLLSNGFKYSPENKPVELTTENQNGILKIAVRDYGIGIPESEQKHMFSRFFRAKNASTIQGTGLGLTIVSRYLKMMNGSVSFKSKEGEGTTFFVEIPL